MSGKIDYDLTQNLEMWTNTDLIGWIQDTEIMMGLEKHQIVNLAQEAAERLSYYLDDMREFDEDEEDDGEDEYPHGREYNE